MWTAANIIVEGRMRPQVVHRLNRICYRKIAKGGTKYTWELHGALRTVFENHRSTSNTTAAS